MLKSTTFALSAALALVTGTASAGDAPKSYTEPADLPSLILAMASPAIASTQRDVGDNTNNGVDLISESVELPVGFGTEAHRRQMDLTYQALVERDEARAQVAYLQSLASSSGDQDGANLVEKNKDFSVMELTCGFPHHCTIGLPEGVHIADAAATFAAAVDVETRKARERTYVVVTTRLDAPVVVDASDDKPVAVPLTLFTNAGPYFFQIRKDGDTPNYFVDLN